MCALTNEAFQTNNKLKLNQELMMMQATSDGSVHDNQYADNPFSTPNITCHTNVP
jgi:hypothetical protein